MTVLSISNHFGDIKHITPSDGKFCGGHALGTCLRGWTTQHNLAFIHPTSSLSAGSTARLYSSPKWLSTQLIPKPSIQPSLSLLIHVSTLQNLLLIPPPPAFSHPSSRQIPLLFFHSPMEASSLLFLLKSDIFQLQRARDETNVTAFLHQATNPPVVVVLL